MSLQWESTIPKKFAVKSNLTLLFYTTGTWIIGLLLLVSFLAYSNVNGSLFNFFISCIFLLLLFSLYFIFMTLKYTNEVYGNETALTITFQLDSNAFSFKSSVGSTSVQLSGIKKAIKIDDMVIVEFVGGRRIMMLKNDTPEEFLKAVSRKSRRS